MTSARKRNTLTAILALSLLANAVLGYHFYRREMQTRAAMNDIAQQAGYWLMQLSKIGLPECEPLSEQAMWLNRGMETLAVLCPRANGISAYGRYGRVAQKLGAVWNEVGLAREEVFELALGNTLGPADQERLEALGAALRQAGFDDLGSSRDYLVAFEAAIDRFLADEQYVTPGPE